MEERVKFKINLYFCKAREKRRWHYLLSCIVAVGAALVPVLINMEKDNDDIDYIIIATIISLIVTIGVAIQQIFHFREHWRNYDLIDSNIRNEEMLYSMSAGPYDKITDEAQKNKLFVERIEELIKTERSETINMRTSGNWLSENKRLVENMIDEYLKEKNLLLSTQEKKENESSRG